MVGPTASLSLADLQEIVDINQKGVFLCVREQVAQMETQDLLDGAEEVTRHRRSKVDMASIAGLVGISLGLCNVQARRGRIR